MKILAADLAIAGRTYMKAKIEEIAIEEDGTLSVRVTIKPEDVFMLGDIIQGKNYPAGTTIDSKKGYSG